MNLALLFAIKDAKKPVENIKVGFFLQYKITYDGKTPFQLDNSSKIVYGADGMPEEIVVFKGESRHGFLIS